ncbi:hypothetical protein TorRG33x02_198300 [Trema orientale]|uniref:Uncharacterized protein n=1 Tax=Trema orientale TaxID=63057 RepID=A0A2P5EFP3_TREOI|nr:hypothetical protein TorRG33x02_198300 [Trema orientale]
MNHQDRKFSTKASLLKYYDPHKYYSSRQNFLRSYKFTKKKETFGTITKKWLIKSKTVIKRQTSASGSGSTSGCRFCGKGMSLRFIVSCMTKLDVQD